jgi:hypothetical protein
MFTFELESQIHFQFCGKFTNNWPKNFKGWRETLQRRMIITATSTNGCVEAAIIDNHLYKSNL